MKRIYIFIASVVLLLLIYLIYLVKNKKINIEYSIIGILSLIIIFLLSFSVKLLNKIAFFLGVAYPPSLIIVVIFLLGIFILLYITHILSKLTNEKKSLMQELVISQMNKFKKNSEILIILPAYNEQKNIESLILNIRKNYEYDILVINDGSTDKTAYILDNINCNHLDLTFNSGYGSALETGYKFAIKYDYEYIVQFDADGQHSIESISKLVKSIKESNNDVVIGSRFLENKNRYNTGFARKIGIILFRFIVRVITKKKMTDPTSGLQILKMRAFEFFSKNNRFPTKYPDADMILLLHKNDFKFSEISVKMYQNKEGKSMHSGVIKNFIYMVQMLLSIFVILISNKE